MIRIKGKINEQIEKLQQGNGARPNMPQLRVHMLQLKIPHATIWLSLIYKTISGFNKISVKISALFLLLKLTSPFCNVYRNARELE